MIDKSYLALKFPLMEYNRTDMGQDEV